MAKITKTSKKKRDLNKLTIRIVKASIYFVLLVLLIIFVFQGVKKSFEFGYDLFEEPNANITSEAKIPFVVTKGQSAYAVGKDLKEYGLIDNPFLFSIQARFFSYKILPGNYFLNEEMNGRNILDIISREPTKDEDEK